MHENIVYCIRDGGDLVVLDNQGERDYFDLLARGIYGKHFNNIYRCPLKLVKTFTYSA